MFHKIQIHFTLFVSKLFWAMADNKERIILTYADHIYAMRDFLCKLTQTMNTVNKKKCIDVCRDFFKERDGKCVASNMCITCNEMENILEKVWLMCTGKDTTKFRIAFTEYIMNFPEEKTLFEGLTEFTRAKTSEKVFLYTPEKPIQIKHMDTGSDHGALVSLSDPPSPFTFRSPDNYEYTYITPLKETAESLQTPSSELLHW